MSEKKHQYFFTWNAARLLTIGAIQRLSFNRSRYGRDYPRKDEKHALQENADKILTELHAYLNLLSRFEETGDEAFITGCFLIINKLDNLLHRFHHTLLNYDADAILEMIQVIDEERRRWSSDSINEVDDFPDILQVSDSISAMFKVTRGLNHLISDSETD